MKKVKEYLIPKVYNAILSETDFEKITEIRLRVNLPLIVNLQNQEIVFETCKINEEDIKNIFNHITEYSAYAYEYSIKKGFITLPGGHRVGFGGEIIYEKGNITNIKNIKFLNFRISHPITGCGINVFPKLLKENNIYNTLIISPPGLGKTTLLRDLVRLFSTNLSGTSICVIDERNEISGSYLGIPSIDLGIRTDVICNCEKKEGILMAVRSMAPRIIAVDEIGREEDLKALTFAMQSGVSIIATMHGASFENAEMKLGHAYKELFDKKLLIKRRGEYICC